MIRIGHNLQAVVEILLEKGIITKEEIQIKTDEIKERREKEDEEYWNNRF